MPSTVITVRPSPPLSQDALNRLARSRTHDCTTAPSAITPAAPTSAISPYRSLPRVPGRIGARSSSTRSRLGSAPSLAARSRQSSASTESAGPSEVSFYTPYHLCHFELPHTVLFAA